jgi:hypothetical protein
VTLLVETETVFQGFVHHGLHPLVHRGADRDPPLNEVFDPEAPPALLLQLSEDTLDRCGGMGLDRAVGCNADRLGLAALRETLGDVTVARHQCQDLIAAAQGARVAGYRGVGHGRLGDSRQQRGLPRVLRRVARQGFAEVVLGGGGEAVAAVAQVEEVGVADEDLAFSLLLRSIAPAHLLLEPERQAHLF